MILRQIAEVLKGSSYKLSEDELEQAAAEGLKAALCWIHYSNMSRFNTRFRASYSCVENISVHDWHRLITAFVLGREAEIAIMALLAEFDPIENSDQQLQASNHWDLRVKNELIDVKLLPKVKDDFQRTTVSFNHFTKISTMFKATEPVSLLAVERLDDAVFVPAMLITKPALRSSLHVQKTDKNYPPLVRVESLISNDPFADPKVCVLTGKRDVQEYVNNGLWILNRKFDWKPS